MKKHVYVLLLNCLVFTQCRNHYLSNFDKIYFPNKKEALYLKQYSEVSSIYIIISSSKSKRYNPESKRDIVFNEEAVFYRYTSDSLLLYCRIEPKINKKYCGKIAVKYTKISNLVFYEMWDHYNEKGLIKFPR